MSFSGRQDEHPPSFGRPLHRGGGLNPPLRSLPRPEDASWPPPPSAPSLGAGVSAPGERGGRCGGVRGEGKNHIPEGNPLPIFTSRPAPRRPGPRSPAHRRYLSAGSRRRGPASSPQVAAEAAAAPPRARPRRSARPAPRLRPAPFAPSRPAAPRPSPSPKRTNQSEQVAR